MLHDEPWVLLIEPDTIPASAHIATQVASDLREHWDAWVIGGTPHPRVTATLQRDLWDHLNGAALFHVGDTSFMHFLVQVWIPSTLEMVSRSQRFAYDCVTSPEISATLSPVLRRAWEVHRGRFISTNGILNLSTLQFSLDQLIDALEPVDGVPESPLWMIHAKGVRPEWAAVFDVIQGTK